MRTRALAVLGLCAMQASIACASPRIDAVEEMIKNIQAARGLDSATATALVGLFRRSSKAGQGNPLITKRPMTRSECKMRLDGDAATHYLNPSYVKICGEPFMAPLFDPARQTAQDATACIDQFEYPNIPCEYPVVWISPREASQVCQLEGKRLCDAHEWEGACAGSLQAPDYNFGLKTGYNAKDAVAARRDTHNAQRALEQKWSYGPEYRRGICAADSAKSPQCDASSGYENCGSNAYPTGSFPDCISPLGVFDLHGNAAEIMNLPLTKDQMSSASGKALGVTELKGSWFIWDRFAAHPDWCRWRAPFWHGTKIQAERGHKNYHLGFRCCKTLR